MMTVLVAGVFGGRVMLGTKWSKLIFTENLSELSQLPPCLFFLRLAPPMNASWQPVLLFIS